MEQSTMVRHTIYYTGRVQGVGFRYTTERIARKYDVAGFVRNLTDGRVELVVEGTDNELARFESDVQTTMQKNITALESSESASTGEYESFFISY